MLPSCYDPSTMKKTPSVRHLALVRFYKSSASDIRGYFRNRGFREEAEDLAQETFARALAAVEGLKDPERVRAWVFVIASNVLCNHARQNRRRIAAVTFSDVDAAGDGPRDPFEGGGHDETPEVVRIASEASEERVERWRQVRRAVREMPPQMRACAGLRYFEGLKQREVAERLGISLSAVKVQLHRASGRLRRELG